MIAFNHVANSAIEMISSNRWASVVHPSSFEQGNVMGKLMDRSTSLVGSGLERLYAIGVCLGGAGALLDRFKFSSMT